MEVREEVPALASEASADVSMENPSISWLQLGFEMSTEEETLKSLAVEIDEATLPLRNIQFTNRYAASYIGGTIFSSAANIESLEAMGEMRVDEATNRVGALISRVSSCLRLTKCFTFCIFVLNFPFL